MLEGEGHLDSHAHVGARVLAFSAQDLAEYTAIRASLDVLACRWVIERLSKQEMNRLIRTLGRVNDELRQGLKAQRPQKAQQAAVKFHRVIYDATGSKLLITVAEPLWTLVPAIFQSLWMGGGSPNRVVEEHEEQMTSIMNRDLEGATTAAALHQEGTLRRIEENRVH